MFARNLTGRRYGRLIVLERSDTVYRQIQWLCRCDCGRTFTTNGGGLKQGKTKSCGCYRESRLGAESITHGSTGTVEYKTWCAIKGRCYNPNDVAYSRYGGRGIRVSPLWVDNFPAFLAHVGKRPGPRYSLDRWPDNDGDYAPGNVRWATVAQQSRNRRTTIVVTLNGQEMALKDAAELLGVPYKTVHARITRGWSIEKALHTPT